MRCSSLIAWLAASAALATLGCSPALNWREVPLGGAKVMLPCKPDRAQRPVPLGVQPMTMEMVGCEADGALFAASRVEVPQAEQAATLARWYSASMNSLGEIAQSQAGPPPWKGRSLAATGQGKAPDGSVVQARFLWQAGSRELILLAVYAPRVTTEMTEPFLIDLKLP